jgi:hypothetical protein
MRPLLFFPLIVCGLLAASAARADDPRRFPALTKLPPASRQAISGLLDWQRSFDDMPEAELRRRLGPPDKTGELSANPVTGKPMHQLIWRLSRRSEAQFTIHQGTVQAVGIILMPSANEAGPVD